MSYCLSTSMVVTLLLFISHFYLISSNTAVIILARGGSKGVRLKNLREVGGISLVSRAILAAKNAGLEDVTVSTDHPLIALEALKYKSKIFKRSFITATDTAPSIWGLHEFVWQRKDIQTLVLLQATSPFTRSEHLRLSLMKLDQPKPYDCIFSVTRSFKLRWGLRANEIKPLNFNPKKRPRRQDWSGEYIETGGFYIIRVSLLQQGYLQNNNCTVWEVSQHESLEIDTEQDILLANTYLNLNIIV